MSRFWSPLVRELKPYVPGEQPQHTRLVKLNTNESPYPPSPAALAAIAAVDADQLRRYPDPESTALRQSIAQRFGVQPEQVFVGNGSDEVLGHVFLGLLRQSRPLLFPDISYSFYPVWCQLYGIDWATVALDEAMAVDVDAFAREAGAIILPNPNAPTGRLLGLAGIRRLLQLHPDVPVVIDEAYIDYGGESASALIADHPNLLVVQTLSKSRALAGLRVGFALGNAELIEALNRVKNSFNSYPLDALAQVAAVASLEDQAWFESSVARVIASRERLSAALSARGFCVLPSAANFVFARPPGNDAAGLYQALRARGIIVRHFAKPRIDAYLRISIGTDTQCDQLLTAVDELLPAADLSGSA